jgi:hypothetical protein
MKNFISLIIICMFVSVNLSAQMSNILPAMESNTKQVGIHLNYRRAPVWLTDFSMSHNNIQMGVFGGRSITTFGDQPRFNRYGAYLTAAATPIIESVFVVGKCESGDR